jgi:WD40 repeat protein
LAIVAAANTVRSVAAQTAFVPYFGKNNPHYDKFEWHIYTTDHFEIYYYPALESHLARIAGYAESAYQQVSADLKHDLPAKVQLILFKTHSEFEQENIDPGAAQEGVGAFAEPDQKRIVAPIDDPPDRLYGLIVHELTHQFEFDIIPQGLIRRSVPLWVNEGLSDYERAQWEPLDLMAVRDAAIADIIPKMTELEGYGGNGGPSRLIYNLGHAVFEFIETRFGKEGIRQFLFALRKSVIGGGEDAYEEALKMKKEEFDQNFEKYLKDRFKPFRDKERPADYGRDLAPNREKTNFAEALAIAPSPSGDLIAVVTVNRKDQELDIVLVSSKDGSIVRNLTAGFDRKMGFDHLVQMGVDQAANAWMAWSPKGDRLAYFVRTAKERTLIVQNVLTQRIELRIPMKTVDEPESPAFSPDGGTIAFDALRDGVGDIFAINLDTKTVTNLTEDSFGERAPSYSPDGKFIVYTARVSGNDKLFRLDLDTRKKTQITFGTQDETGAEFIDDHTIVFASTATDPAIALEPDVTRNGNILNIWTLDLTSGELRQYTDAVSGNWSPTVLNEGKTNRIVFVSYFKNEYSIRTLERKEPLHTVASADFGAPGAIIDFQAPLQHTIVAANAKKKGLFEKMFLQGRPPVNVGVTSNGDIFGGTQVSMADVLGDKQINLFASSVSQYRTVAFSYVDLSKRFQWALQGFDQTTFYYATGSQFYDSAYNSVISRDNATSTRTILGGVGIGIYPLDRYRRVELSAGLYRINEQYENSSLQAYSEQYQQETYGTQVFSNGTLIPLSAAFVQETTVFREFGPLSGNTMRLAYEVDPKIAGSLSRQTVDVDLRHYLRLGTTGLIATRFKGFRSFGQSPSYSYFGGNSEMRGYDYLQFVGQNAMFANAELRFPLIEAALTPIGVVGGVRGVFYGNVGAGWFDGQGFTFASRETSVSSGTTVQGFRLDDGRASYGLGLETFVLGFPIHFDWSWRTLFNQAWENVVFASDGGSAKFRRPRFAVWIGYDF